MLGIFLKVGTEVPHQSVGLTAIGSLYSVLVAMMASDRKTLRI